MKPVVTMEASNNWALGIWETVKTAERLLRQSAYLELRNLKCDFHEGVLTIRGHVPSYFLKQLAQSLLLNIDGLLELNNQLVVLAPGESRSANFHSTNIYRYPQCRSK
jgi:hypothetical protein